MQTIQQQHTDLEQVAAAFADAGDAHLRYVNGLEVLNHEENAATTSDQCILSSPFQTLNPCPWSARSTYYSESTYEGPHARVRGLESQVPELQVPP